MTLDELNNTAADYPRDRCLHELFEAQAAAWPDRIAVVCGDDALTYRELDERAARLAGRLVALGIGPDVLTAICLDRSVEMVVAVMGVLKSGGAYVPIDPAYPADRIAFMLEDAAVKAIVSRHSLATTLSSPATPVVMIDELAPVVDPPPLYRPPTPGNLAYVRYTSGSTGKPKGVQIEHRAIVNFITSMRKTPGLSESDVLLSVTTLSFDISELEIHLPLTTGACVVISTLETVTSGSALIALIARHGVTVMQATPATWRLMLEAGWAGTPELKVLCGGESWGSDLARQLVPRCAELWNMYGPTETTVWSTCCRITDPTDINIGRPIANTEVHIFDAHQQPLAVGGEGELLIGGDSVARGYLNRPELTAEKFIPHPSKPGQRLYRTGDLARFRPDGAIDCLGRLDFQIKVQGIRIEPGEIEAVLATHPAVRQAVVVAREDASGDKRLVAYFTTAEGKTPSVSELRALVQDRLPAYMVPAAFVPLAKIPLTPNGKVDSKALPKPTHQRPALGRDFIAPNSLMEKQMAALWSEVLGIEPVGIDDSFFELGGTSLQAVRLASAWQSRYGSELPLVKIFQYPTVAGVVAWLENRNDASGFLAEQERRALRSRSAAGGGGRQPHIAIIGMAGRFPGAGDLETLWRNLCAGVESISVFSREELGVGIDEALRYDSDYVPARGIIDGVEMFDAAFFGIGALEASVMDPQQRVFLELAYAALENAGYDPDRCPGTVGVYAGAGDNHYYAVNLLGHPQLLARAGRLAVEYGNEKDYIALRTAYLLNLTGPAVSSNTACSTTLLTVDQAARGLASFECDMALAGGIDIAVPQKSGFFYEEGGTFSRDGHCRPFDTEATGTMFCDGAGIVVLKRLEDAIAAGDTIYAVIRGTAKNNNGARTASFLAPSVEGQAEVVAMAQANADVPVETIGYIEAHGTGTPVGDPIEIEALNMVFNAKTAKRQFCYLGSIKGNIGHPTNAAGIAGVIKAALVLHREEIPPTLHFRKANPKIDFENSCFKVADRLIPFPRMATPRRVAASAFGFGGTNVHAILEEAPPPKPSGSSRPMHLVAVSARTDTALAAYSGALAGYFEGSQASDFADAAATLLRGRKQWPHRRFVVAGAAGEAAALLRKPHPLHSAVRHCTRRDPPVVFLFGGQGTQYVNMGQNLYQTEPLFRAAVDECCEALRPHLGCDLRTILYPAKDDEETASASLRNTTFTQPAIFTIEYALSVWWRSLGVEPATMVGHSIGEFVAATIAGVFTLPDVLRVVAARGRLMQSMPGGAMLSVRASADEIQPLLPPEVELAAINSPSLCVISGPVERVASVQPIFEARGWVSRELFTSHAFHSHMMEPMLEPLRRELAGTPLQAPVRPLMSTVTGEPMTPEQACDPDYWARQARMTVRFSATATWLLDHGYDLFLECGPRATMSTLTRQHALGRPVTTIASMGDSNAANAESAALLFALGSLWLQGTTIDWEAFYAHEERRRIPLPTYPFERQRHWVEPIAAAAGKIEPSALSAAAPTSALIPAPRVRTQCATDAVPTAPVERRLDRIRAKLSEIIGHIMGLNPAAIDIGATFFELGLDSLSLVQVTNALRNELKVKVSFSQLMNQFPSIAMLTEYLATALPADSFGAEPVVNAVPPAGSLSGAPGPAAADLWRVVEEQGRMIALLAKQVENRTALPQSAGAVTEALCAPRPTAAAGAVPAEIEFPATVPQRGIFLSSRLSDNLSASYNESMTIHLTGRIDLARLTSAIRSLVQRHDALRARFDETGRSMSLPPVRNVAVDVVDLSGLDANARERQLESLVAEETARPFPLPAGPLFRARVMQLDATRADVVLTGHHTICDGWSLDVLIHDLCAYYSAELEGKPAVLKPVMPYGEYVRKCAIRAASSEFHSARQYYEARFAETFPALVLPTAGKRSAGRRFACQREEAVVPPSVVQSLRAFGVHHQCGLFSLVLAAYSIFLARVSGQRRFVIALPTAEQPVLDQPHLVGHCVNMLPFEVNIEPGETVAAFLAGVQRQLSHAYDHSAYTVTHLIQRLRPAAPHVGIRPVSVGLTSIKKWRLSDLPTKGFTIDFDVTPRQFESFEFYLMAIEQQDELVLRCNFDCDLFDQATAAGWMQEFALLLSALPEKSAIMLESLVRPTIAPSAPPLGAHYILAAECSDPELDASAAPESPATQTNGAALTLEALIRVWQDVLGTNPIGPDDNFFDLGGQSLLALTLALKVQKTFGVSYPLAALLKAPTPRQSLALLQESDLSAHFRYVVPIARDGNLTPVFLFHSHGGNVLEYYRLATLLGSERSVYAIQCQGVDGGELPPPVIEKMVQAYLEEIRVIQPNGPYVLAGYCFGGLLAIEAARQLKAAGQETGLIVMINAATADYPRCKVRGPSGLRRMTWRVGDRLAIEHFNIAGKPVADKLSKLRARAGRMIDLLRVRAERIAVRGLALVGRKMTKHSFVFHLEELGLNNDLAWFRYVPHPYDGKVLFFVAERQSREVVPDPMLGWEGLLTGKVLHHVVQGFRQHLLDEPAVFQLAATIKDTLADSHL
jgi:amino acid adenylation domain-containing protein